MHLLLYSLTLHDGMLVIPHGENDDHSVMLNEQESCEINLVTKACMSVLRSITLCTASLEAGGTYCIAYKLNSENYNEKVYIL